MLVRVVMYFDSKQTVPAPKKGAEGGHEVLSPQYFSGEMLVDGISQTMSYYSISF